MNIYCSSLYVYVSKLNQDRNQNHKNYIEIVKFVSSNNKTVAYSNQLLHHAVIKLNKSMWR